jgi:hypothetical protein
MFEIECGAGAEEATHGDRPLVQWHATRSAPIFLRAVKAFLRPKRIRSGWRGLADELGDDGAEGEKRHERNNAQRNDAVDAPDAEDMGFDVGEVE